MIRVTETLIVSLFALLFTCSCSTPSGARMEPSADSRSIELVVLCHLVKTDQSSRLVMFVDLPSDDIQELGALCGGGHEIESSKMAEWTQKEALVGDISPRFLRLRDTEKEGVILRVEIKEIRGKSAEVIGTTIGSAFTSQDRFQLRFSGGRWQIVSVKAIFAS